MDVDNMLTFRFRYNYRDHCGSVAVVRMIIRMPRSALNQTRFAFWLFLT